MRETENGGRLKKIFASTSTRPVDARTENGAISQEKMVSTAHNIPYTRGIKGTELKQDTNEYKQLLMRVVIS